MTIKLQREPLTVARLCSLKHGEQIVFYRGNFPSDIERCDRRKNLSGDTGAPKYKELLKSVAKTADKLEEQGKIKIIQHPESRWVLEYVAIGTGV
jgi:hypothetical protein